MSEYRGPDIFRFGRIGGKRNYAMWMLRWLCQHGRRKQREFMTEYHRIGATQTGWGNGFDRFVRHTARIDAMREYIKTAPPQEEAYVERLREIVNDQTKVIDEIRHWKRVDAVDGYHVEDRSKPKELQWAGPSPSEIMDGSPVGKVRDLFVRCEYLATNSNDTLDVEHAEFWMHACLRGLERRGERP